MWKSVGLFRDRSSLRDACHLLHEQHAALDDGPDASAALDRDGWRRASIVTVALLVARAALRREESRGGHFREDFPQRDDIHWQRRIADRL